MANLENLLADIRSCQLCHDLPLGAKPIVQFSTSSKILIAGQAPGRVTHEKGRPFDDASGERLRAWLGVTREQFYDERLFAIVPMGFCFPGTGASGDLAPRKECAEHWRATIMEQLQSIELVLVIGQYAMDWHLKNRDKKRYNNVTETVRHWREITKNEAVMTIPLPHPSPRNNLWLKKNPWFNEQLLPELQSQVAQLVAQ